MLRRSAPFSAVDVDGAIPPPLVDIGAELEAVGGRVDEPLAAGDFPLPDPDPDEHAAADSTSAAAATTLTPPGFMRPG